MTIRPGQWLHFIGIGGISMSALALTMAARGHKVTGSDRDDGDQVHELRSAGIAVSVGQRAENAVGPDLFVYTTAVRETNPELAAARATGKPILHRSEVLAALLEGHRAIAVTGAHGKSTTTAMLGLALAEAGADPTVYVGGHVPEFGAAHRIGRGELLVFEACESDGSFLRYTGCSQVLTNVEADHLDEHGSFEALQETYAAFVALADPGGFCVYNADDAIATRLSAACPARRISFGLSEASSRGHVSATGIRPEGSGISYTLLLDGRPLRDVRLRIPGRHNVANALAATAAVIGCSLDPSAACEALETFRGVGRRFERYGQLNGAILIHDYAHHPTELRAALRAAREVHIGEVIVAFQPHLYSRTQQFLEEFAAAFDEADRVLLTDIYAAREEPIPGVTSERLAELVGRRLGPERVRYVGDLAGLEETLRAVAAPGRMLLIVGAGNIKQVAHSLAQSSGGREDET